MFKSITHFMGAEATDECGNRFDDGHHVEWILASKRRPVHHRRYSIEQFRNSREKNRDEVIKFMDAI